jgi:23S rRNA pseudouridine955/2504/2580 synthase
MKKFTVNTNTNLRDFTDGVYPQGSFHFNALLRNSDIRVNGVKVRTNVIVNCGDEVTYYTNSKQEQKPSHYVVYEDENIAIIDKESGVSYEGLLYELNEKGTYFGVHRLDRNTSGLISFAKNGQAESQLLAAFRDKDIVKTYECFAKNAFKKQGEYMTAYLKKDEKLSKVYISDSPKDGYDKIITEYKVLKRMGDYCLVQVTLHTGKTHQIRAHLAHIGCPVLGDEKYGDEALNKKYGAKRQILVAKNLAFKISGSLSYLNDKTFESRFIPQLPTLQ